MQAQLIALSQTGAWINIEKSRQDMAFLLIVPSIAIGCERMFGLTVVWAQTCATSRHKQGLAIHLCATE